VPHYFYRALDRYISDDVALAPIKQLLVERLIFMPLFQILALYMLARLEVSFLFEYFFVIINAGCRKCLFGLEFIALRGKEIALWF